MRTVEVLESAEVGRGTLLNRSTFEKSGEWAGWMTLFFVSVEGFVCLAVDEMRLWRSTAKRDSMGSGRDGKKGAAVEVG